MTRTLLALAVLMLIASAAVAHTPKSAPGIQVVGHSTTSKTVTRTVQRYQSPAVQYYAMPAKSYSAQSYAAKSSYSMSSQSYGYSASSAKSSYAQRGVARRFLGERRPVRRVIGLPFRLFGRLCGR